MSHVRRLWHTVLWVSWPQRFSISIRGVVTLQSWSRHRNQNVVYYESIKRELQIKPTSECRCDERLQTKTKIFSRLSYTRLVVELEHLKIKTRLTNEKVYECEGWVWDLDTIGSPSRLRLIRKTVSLLTSRFLLTESWWVRDKVLFIMNR